MLPMLDKKRMSTAILQRRKGKLDVEVSPEIQKPSEDQYPELTEAATDILSAIESKSPLSLAKALKAAFEICESYPHEEMDMEMIDE